MRWASLLEGALVMASNFLFSCSSTSGSSIANSLAIIFCWGVRESSLPPYLLRLVTGNFLCNSREKDTYFSACSGDDWTGLRVLGGGLWAWNITSGSWSWFILTCWLAFSLQQRKETYNKPWWDLRGKLIHVAFGWGLIDGCHALQRWWSH